MQRTFGSTFGSNRGWQVLLGAILLVGCGTPPVYKRNPALGIDGGAVADSGVGDRAQADSGADGGLPLGTAGSAGSGGIAGSGGGQGTGGAIATGGTGTGGTSTGGTPGSGGGPNTGGRGTGGAGTGGTSGTGGAGTGGASAGGSSTGGAGTGGRGTGGVTGTGGATPTDSAKYNFESSLQGWAAPSGTPAFMTIARSTTTVFAGQGALAGTIAATATAKYQLGVAPSPAIPAGATVTYHLWIPAGAAIDWVQPYVQEGSPNYTWTGNTVLTANLASGAWNTVTVKVPTTAGTIIQMGVQFDVTGTWSGPVYIDSVSW